MSEDSRSLLPIGNVLLVAVLIGASIFLEETAVEFKRIVELLVEGCAAWRVASLKPVCLARRHYTFFLLVAIL